MDFKLFSICENQRNQRETERTPADIHRKSILNFDIINLSTCSKQIGSLVENKLVIEIKTVEALCDVHTAQILTYLKLGNYKSGLIINFNVTLLKNGIIRFIN